MGQFNSIHGQERSIKVVKRLILQNRLPHAILLIGKERIGKRAFARAVARVLLCDHKSDNAEACGKCNSCRKVDALSHPDLMIIGTEGNTIKIDQIRAIIEKTSYRTAKDRFRVVIVEEAEKLSDEASNALLKILEEPPERNIFILTSSRHHQILPTIRSRCCHIALQPIPHGELLKMVEEKAGHLPYEEALFYALLADGSCQRLEELLTASHDPFPWSSLSSRIKAIAQMPMWQFFSEVGKWVEDYPNLETLLQHIKIWLAILIRNRVAGKGVSLSEQRNNCLADEGLLCHSKEDSKGSPPDGSFSDEDIDKYLDFFETIEEAEQALKFNVNKMLLLGEIGLEIKDCFI